MNKITAETSLQEIAVLVSETLEEAGVLAVLGGGAAVTHYSNNEYMSTDLDFITTERNKTIAPIIADLGFKPQGKDFYHPDSKFFLEFPRGPLSFGDKYVESSETVTIKTKFGSLRIITPTQCVMDRLAWVVHGNDPQSKDQAVMVAKHQQIDWDEIIAWAAAQDIDSGIIKEIRAEAGAG